MALTYHEGAIFLKAGVLEKESTQLSIGVLEGFAIVLVVPIWNICDYLEVFEAISHRIQMLSDFEEAAVVERHNEWLFSLVDNELIFGLTSWKMRLEHER